MTKMIQFMSSWGKPKNKQRKSIEQKDWMQELERSQFHNCQYEFEFNKKLLIHLTLLQEHILHKRFVVEFLRGTNQLCFYFLNTRHLARL